MGTVDDVTFCDQCGQSIATEEPRVHQGGQILCMSCSPHSGGAPPPHQPLPPGASGESAATQKGWWSQELSWTWKGTLLFAAKVILLVVGIGLLCTVLFFVAGPKVSDWVAELAGGMIIIGLLTRLANRLSRKWLNWRNATAVSTSAVLLFALAVSSWTMGLSKGFSVYFPCSLLWLAYDVLIHKIKERRRAATGKTH